MIFFSVFTFQNNKERYGRPFRQKLKLIYERLRYIMAALGFIMTSQNIY